MEVVMDSMRICALALAVQFASTFLLGGCWSWMPDAIYSGHASTAPMPCNRATALAHAYASTFSSGEWQWKQST